MDVLKRREAPDFRRLLKVLQREGDAAYVPFLEMVFEPGYLEPLTGLKAPTPLAFSPRAPSYEASFAYYLKACAAAGFDHGTINLCGFGGFPRMGHASEALGRSFQQAADGVIRSDGDVESYPWPSAAQIDVEAMERTARQAPGGMGVLTGGPEPFSIIFDLLGLEFLSISLYENPDLVRRLADRAGAIMVDVCDLVCSLPFIDGFLFSGDMGYKTGTMIAPADLRRYILPWHRAVVKAAHRHGKICLLHSCGNLHEIMPDIIACGYDGKHSFEDAIRPGVLDLNREFGRDICMIGGIDVDFLCRSSEQAIRKRVRNYIDALAPAGGWVLGSGNSIPEYCPVASWWAMLDEGLKYGRP